jgi:hypothetical protein
MSAERIDAETLAAFLDGKLEPAERERVLGILAENPEEYETFSDAAHAAATLAGTSVTPIETHRRGRPWRVAIPALVAASIVTAVVVLPRLDGRGTSPVDLAGRLKVVTVPGDGSLAARLGADWDQPGWSVTRGGGTDIVEPARAFRIGARAMDAEVALRAGDTTALKLVGTELVNLIAGLDGGAVAAAQYRSILDAGTETSDTDRLMAAEAAAVLLEESPWFDLGAWSEAVRLAALAGDREFLVRSAGPLEEIVTRIEAAPAGDRVEMLHLLREVQMALAGITAAIDLDSLSALVNRVMAAGGR